jgi:superfamily II DNA/RNA helicase
MSPTFRDLGVPPRIVSALEADGITEPFAIQTATLADALAGRDLCGRAPTGSGKTLAFGIPLMARVGEAVPRHPTGLILVPTRELALQVKRSLIPLGRAAWRYVLAVYGGSRFEPQIDSLKKGASVVVATPGRLLDLIERKQIFLDAVEVAVIDEADRMADLGFMPDVSRLLDMLPQQRQTMLWSATLDGDVDMLIRRYQRDPVRHEVADRASEAHHHIQVVRKIERVGAVATLVRSHGATLVFTRTRDGAEKLAEQLRDSGVSADAIHGNRSQAQREHALHRFRTGKVDALVATDVAARGIHVDDVSLVVHWDLPADAKDYVHRSGRTARAGADGKVVSLVTREARSRAERLLRTAGVSVTNATPRTDDRGATIAPVVPTVKDLGRQRRVRPQTDAGHRRRGAGNARSWEPRSRQAKAPR